MSSQVKCIYLFFFFHYKHMTVLDVNRCTLTCSDTSLSLTQRLTLMVWCVCINWHHRGVTHLLDFDRWETAPPCWSSTPFEDGALGMGALGISHVHRSRLSRLPDPAVISVSCILTLAWYQVISTHNIRKMEGTVETCQGTIAMS